MDMKVKPRMNIGQKIDKLWLLREKKRAKDAESKLIGDEIDALEAELMHHMTDEGTDKAAGKKATVSITKSVVPQAIDWDAFYAYIHRHKYYHLLERRPAVAGCRELFDAGKKIPGIEPFTKVKLNLRTANA